ncbi:MAG: carboxypeptidase regulatory-like domain-containing protein [Planctomycetes bacterium]|nr:carboxypeptidase regulatory-like domain-containing protein [Planctomycetota bacterium]
MSRSSEFEPRTGRSRALKLAVPALLLGLAALWWWSGRAALVRGRPEFEPAPVVPPSYSAPAPELEPAAREALPRAATPPALASAESSAAPTISGRVLDVHGSPVGAARIAWKPAQAGDEEAKSAADGSFALALGARAPVVAARVACLEPELVTLVPGNALGRWTVVVAPRLDCAGMVVDEDGEPVAGAEVAFLPRAALFRELGLHPLGLDTEGWRTRSDDAGRFELHGIAGGVNVGLEASAPGHDGVAADLPATGARDLVLVLRRRPGTIELRGVVLEPTGAPCANARVSAGQASTGTDAFGRFALPFDGASGGIVHEADGRWTLQDIESATLIALAEQRLPARESLLERDLAAPFVLLLGAAPLTLAGRIRDATGAPCAGLVLWLDDTTHFERAWERLPNGSGMAKDASVEALLGGGVEPFARSDVDGHFELGGLMEREYALFAFDPRSATCAGPWPVVAGDRALELEFLRESTRRVAGRVLSAHGTPRAGLELRPRPTLETCLPPRGAGLELGVTTDADGRFEFALLSTSVVQLQLRSRHGSRSVSLAERTDLEHLELVEPELCELQVEHARAAGAVEHIELLDARGERLELRELFGSERGLLSSAASQAMLLDGRSGLLLVPETARTLVLFQGEAELLRLPVELDPARRTVLRP